MPRIYVMPALIAANVIVYALMCLNGVDFWKPDVVALVRWGASYGSFTVDGHQRWRIDLGNVDHTIPKFDPRARGGVHVELGQS